MENEENIINPGGQEPEEGAKYDNTGTDETNNEFDGTAYNSPDSDEPMNDFDSSDEDEEDYRAVGQAYASPAKKDRKPVIIAAIVLGILCLAATAQLVNVFTSKNNPQGQTEQISAEEQQKMGDDFYKAASGEDAGNSALSDNQSDNQNSDENFGAQDGAQADSQLSENGENLSELSQEEQKPEEPLVTVNLAANVGRVNPFVPTGNYGSYVSDIPRLPSTVNFPAPPTELTVNQPAINLMETTISGIMYDAISPSAIVKVEGRDHLVRKGDRINGYKILNITKDRVIVQNGTNVYRASVGETIKTESTGEINFNTVDNLTTKFGGASAPKGTKMIEIN